MAVKLRFVVMCRAAAPLLLNLAVVGTLLGVPPCHFVPTQATCHMHNLQCGELNGDNAGKACPQRVARDNAQPGLFGCEEDLHSETICVVDGQNDAPCFDEAKCEYKASGSCGPGDVYAVPANTMTTDDC